MSSLLRVSAAPFRTAIFCVCVSFAAQTFAANARVTDVSGQEYEIKSIRLAVGSRLDLECGGAQIKVPFKSIKEMTIEPTEITSINGALHFGVELRMKDSTVIGEGGGCFVPARNGVRGKRSKAKISIPFERLSRVFILGKEDVESRTTEATETQLAADAEDAENNLPSENAGSGEVADAEDADE